MYWKERPSSLTHNAPPPTRASTGDQSAVSGPPPSVCTCVFARVTQGQQISGRVCWQTGKVLTQINTLSQAREHALATSAQTLRSFAMWVFVWVFLRVCTAADGVELLTCGYGR